MPDQPWNHTYTEADDWNTPAVYRTFAKAWSERRAAIGRCPLSHDADYMAGVEALNIFYDDTDVPEELGLPPGDILPATSPAVPVVDDDPLTVTLSDAFGNTTPATVTPWKDTFAPGIGDDVLLYSVWALPADYAAHWNWPELVNDVIGLSRYFADPDSVDPEAQTAPLLGDATGAYAIPTLLDRHNAGTWPTPSGWTRKREREITSVSDDGDDGQRARFIWLTTSAAGDFKYGARIFDRVAGEWVLSSDQTSDVDIVTSYGPPQPGDLFGPWVLNDLQAAINSMWITFEGVYVGSGYASPTGAVTSYYYADAGDIGINADSIVATPPGPGTADDLAAATTNAEAAFPAAVSVYTLVDGTTGQHYGGTMYEAYNEDSSDPAAVGWSAIIQVVPVKPTLLGTPHPCNRTVDFYLASSTLFGEVSTSALTDMRGTKGFLPAGDYDANGTGLLDRQWHKVSTVGPTSSAEVTGGPVGDPASIPDAPTLAGGEFGHSCGYQTGDVLAIIRWNVSGGFQYVAP
jgi:hypothetical protein